MKILELHEKDEFAEAVLYYLQCGDRKQRKFVEKLLDTYAEIEESQHFEGGKCLFLSTIPDEIVSKLISAHSEEMKKYILKTNQEMIAEMNEIF